MVGRGLRQGQGRRIARGIKNLYILGVLDLAQEKPLTEGPAIVRGFLLPFAYCLLCGYVQNHNPNLTNEGKMQFPDNRGAASRALAIKNKIAIADFFKANPAALQKECAAATGLSIATVENHVRDMKKNGVPTMSDAARANG